MQVPATVVQVVMVVTQFLVQLHQQVVVAVLVRPVEVLLAVQLNRVVRAGAVRINHSLAVQVQRGKVTMVELAKVVLVVVAVELVRLVEMLVLLVKMLVVMVALVQPHHYQELQ